MVYERAPAVLSKLSTPHAGALVFLMGGVRNLFVELALESSRILPLPANAHRLDYHSTLGLRVITKKKKFLMGGVRNLLVELTLESSRILPLPLAPLLSSPTPA